MDNALEIKMLKKKYKEGFCLNDISLSLPKGRIMGLIGQNGAGKTTLIKLILGLIKKDGGEVFIGGKENLDAREDIGVVLDECAFSQHFNAEDVNLIMKGIYKQWSEEEFFSYLNKLEIPRKLIINKYSKGMKMKLSIATSISHNAKLLVMDEAMNGLDPVARTAVLDIFRDYMTDERAMLISSHITSDLERICDYISFIDNGRLLLCSDKDVLLEDSALMRVSNEDLDKLDKKDVIGIRKTKFNCEVLVKNKSIVKDRHPNFAMDSVTLEDIMVYYIGGK